jgi:glycyl-tRNA synthetase (class II)
LTAHSKRTGDKLIARQVLDEPIIRDRLVLEIIKPKFGPVFKKNAIYVQQALESYMNSEGDWDVEKLNALSSQFQSGNGYFFFFFKCVKERLPLQEQMVNLMKSLRKWSRFMSRMKKYVVSI